MDGRSLWLFFLLCQEQRRRSDDHAHLQSGVFYGCCSVPSHFFFIHLTLTITTLQLLIYRQDSLLSYSPCCHIRWFDLHARRWSSQLRTIICNGEVQMYFTYRRLGLSGALCYVAHVCYCRRRFLSTGAYRDNSDKMGT